MWKLCTDRCSGDHRADTLVLPLEHDMSRMSTTGCFEYGQAVHHHQGATRRRNGHLVVSALATYYVSLHHQLAARQLGRPRKRSSPHITSTLKGVDYNGYQQHLYNSYIYSTSSHHVSQRPNHRRLRHRIRLQQPCEEPTPRCQDGRSAQRYVELLSVRPFFCRFKQADQLWNCVVMS